MENGIDAQANVTLAPILTNGGKNEKLDQNDLEAAVKHVKEVFLSVYCSQIVGEIRARKYGPLTAEDYKDACAEGYIHTLTHHWSQENSLFFALGFGQGYIEKHMKTVDNLAHSLSLAQMKTKEIFSIGDEKLFEIEEWCEKDTHSD